MYQKSIQADRWGWSVMANEGFEERLRLSLGSRLLRLPGFWTPKLGTRLEGDRDGDLCRLGGWLGHRGLHGECALRGEGRRDQGWIHTRGQPGHAERKEKSHIQVSHCAFLQPPTIWGQNSRVFSSEAPGDEAVLILSLFVLAWGRERRSEGAEWAASQAGPYPNMPHPPGGLDSRQTQTGKGIWGPPNCPGPSEASG